jgi:rfaE bifunctional protein kinase chain/domain
MTRATRHPRGLAEPVVAWQGRRVLVVGDPVLDVYLYGTTHRISREAPVLVVREDAREARLGGAANVAANLAALGAKAELLGLVGDDDGAGQLAALASAHGIDANALVRSPGRATVTKTRVLAGGIHTRKQQMIRIDRENDNPPSAADLDRLLEAATTAIAAADAVVISDYSDGSLAPTYARIAALAIAAEKKAIVDSRTALRQFPGVTAIKGNELEVEAALGLRLSSGESALDAARTLVDTLGLEAALVSRGREGMAVAAREKRGALLPPHGAPEAIDVTGAGDTVTATLALGLASGAPILEAAILANCAASLVVQRLGAATCTPDELIDTLALLGADTLAVLD